MFTDGRSKKVVFIAHCLLNQNAISDGTAIYPATFKDVIELFVNEEVGIVQLPCPELSCLGIDRGNENGANRSPNCGVDTTSDNDEEINGKGLFMSELYEKLEKENLSIPMIGLKSTDDYIVKITTLIQKNELLD